MQRWLHFAGCLVLPTSLVVVGVAWCLAWYANVRPKMAAPPEIVVLASDQIQDKVCNNVVQIAESSIKDHGFFSVGVSGGSLAKLLCTGLKSRPGIDWAKWHVFYCDERHVPFSSEDSTHGYFKANLYDHVGIKPENVCAIDTDVDVSAAAVDYVAKIRRLYPGEDLPRFDLLLLGMGPDGHTCSLFPDHPGLEEDRRLIIPITDSPKPPPSRITMTYPVLNNAANVLVVATGASKAEAVKKCLRPEGGVAPLPTGRVKPSNGRLTWYLDDAAAQSVK